VLSGFITYGRNLGPCFKATIENEENLDEIIRTFEEAYR
jgi:hypothetical protein